MLDVPVLVLEALMTVHMGIKKGHKEECDPLTINGISSYEH